jgi:hypothetical protein
MTELLVSFPRTLADAMVGLLASLPMSFRAAEDRPPDIIIVDGADSSWPSAAISAVGLDATVLVHQPRPTSAASVRALARESSSTSARVVLSESAAGAPAVDQLLRSGIPDALSVGFAWSTGPTDELRTMLFNQLRLLRRLGVRDLRRVAVDISTHAISVAAIGGLNDADLSLDLLASASAVARHRLRLYGWTSGVELDLPDDGTARPAHVELIGPHGATTFPTIYERADRATLRSLSTATHENPDPTPLDAFAADCELLSEWLEEHH